jgi:hypothetical protein
MQVLQRCRDLPVEDPNRQLLPRLLQALASPLPDEQTAAANAVFFTCGPADVRLVARAVKGLLPRRRALQTAVRTLQAHLGWDRGRLLSAARAVLTVLADDPLTAGLRAELAAAALPWKELADLLTRLAAKGELHADALAAAAQALTVAAGRLGPPDLESLEAALASAADERLRRLALAVLVAGAQPPRGWSEARLERLRAFRADPAPLVAAVAQFTLPAEDKG